MHIKLGIDFDNTLACYDDVFYTVACEQGLIPSEFSRCKTHIRDHLRKQKKEELWTQLQGFVYGAAMHLAHPFAGVENFFSSCQTLGIQPVIISHRTRYPYLGPRYDLHAAARQWLCNYAFFQNCEAFFEPTLKDKLHRIDQQQCHFFIDDLPELLKEPSFPPKVTKILFDPGSLHSSTTTWLTLSSWHQLPSILQTCNLC